MSLGRWAMDENVVSCSPLEVENDTANEESNGSPGGATVVAS